MPNAPRGVALRARRQIGNLPLCDEESGGRLKMVSARRPCTSRGQSSSEMLDDGIPEGRADHLCLAFAIPHPQPIRR